MSGPLLSRIGAAAALACAVVLPGFAKAAQETVIAPEASDRGEYLYFNYCAACHGSDLGGISRMPALAGEEFRSRWSGRESELFALVRETMPPPGMDLSDETYREIVGYLARKNGLTPPAGPAVVPAPAL